jgi:hypothetical protein
MERRESGVVGVNDTLEDDKKGQTETQELKRRTVRGKLDE